MRTNRGSESGPAIGSDALVRIRKLVAAYEASSVLMREREDDSDDDSRGDGDGTTHAGIDRDFVASSWSAPRRRHRTARRGR